MMKRRLWRTKAKNSVAIETDRAGICMQLAENEIFNSNNGSDLACSTCLTDGPGQVNAVTGWNDTLTRLTQNALAGNQASAVLATGVLSSPLLAALPLRIGAYSDALGQGFVCPLYDDLCMLAIHAMALGRALWPL